MGELGDFDVAGILELLGRRAATGRLRLSTDGDEAAVYLDGGRLVLVTSSRLPLRLGRVLQARGLLDTPRLHEALREQDEGLPRRSLGSILVARGWATAAEVARCVEEQCVAVVARIMAAGRGSFAYDPGIVVPTGIGAPLDAERILAEATCRAAELATLRALLPAPHAPLAPGARLELGLAPLSPTEERIVVALRAGAGCFAELADLLPVDETALLRAVIGLRERGLVIAGHGAPGSELDMTGDGPPSEDDLLALLGVMDD